MPVIFIHGVATRTSAAYEREAATRTELMGRLLIEPISRIDSRWKDMEIASPYWGDLGVQHYWGQATVPPVRTLEDLGAADDVTAADLETAEILETIGAPEVAGRLESPGTDASLRRAWLANPQAAMEALLAPIVHGEESVILPDDLPAEQAPSPAHAQGVWDAVVLTAAAQVAEDDAVAAAVAASTDDADVRRIITESLLHRTGKMADCPAILGNPPSSLEGQVSPAKTNLENLGPGWFDAVRNRVGWIISRVDEAPSRAATVAVLDRFRDNLHADLTLFIGDVFAYLLRRGEAGAPGPIVERILAAIDETPRIRPDEPLVILSHSMGGNIVYDLLTTYRTDLKVDAWISAGGQVGQFEEMKIFKASSTDAPPAPPLPPKVASLGGRVRSWLNVYDPADILSFLVEPVFTDQDPAVRIKDLKFKSGVSALKAHGAYFTRPSFYELVRKELGY
jgi:hypothetical protein